MVKLEELLPQPNILWVMAQLNMELTKDQPVLLISKTMSNIILKDIEEQLVPRLEM
jgi:hypothetical protein